ncbi:hypothetical protein ANO11243_015640 [Dothideomycetidae sp. 11243]|nr:hypothetical protein ANO11243_015640 [fungal sp. No.11243]
MPAAAGYGRKRTHFEVIDLTNDDEDDRQHQRPKSGQSSQSGARSLSSQTSLATSQDDDDAGDGNELIASTQNVPANVEAFVLYGIQLAKVVGIRYYNGYAANKERVLLRREPHNQYDRNAIQREAEEKRRRAEELKKATKGQRKQTDPNTTFTNAGITVGDPENAPEIDDFIEGAQAFNPREWTNVAEQNSAQEAQLKALPKAEQPDLIPTALLPFQLQGLAWMLEKENPVLPKSGSDDIVQLWKRPSKDMYTNIATNFSLKGEEPKLARGGILADDMGLGKTLQIISLIAADRTLQKGRGPTLIVAPVSVMSNWSNQVERHVKSKSPLKVYTYHGSGRQRMQKEDFEAYDVVVTSYGTLSAEYLPKSSKQPIKLPTKHGIYSLRWRRIVLDEGHTIRNPNTKNAISACAVDAYANWVLTGTPVINSFKDLFSLVKFIGLSGGLDKAEIFNSVLTRPMKEGQADAKLLLQALMATICLRRRKDMAFVDLRLPSLKEFIHHVELTRSERKKYDALEGEAKGALESYDAAGGASNGRKRVQTYRHLLEVLLRMRQVCNHWKMCETRVLDLMSLLDKKGSVDLTPANVKALQDLLQLSIESREECPVCIDDLHDPVITPCGHFFGRSCIARVIETQHKCPMCRAALQDEYSLVSPAIDCGDDASQAIADVDDNTPTSSKTDALLQLVAATVKRSGAKVVVFSQWRSYLDIVQPRLEEAGHGCVRIDGSMPARARDESLRSFAKKPKVTVMLASLGVCAVGLDLTAADTVIMCDSWWAPAIEDQAVDRVHRLGQTKDCTVWRLVVKNSVEERTLEIQKRKRTMMAEALREGGQGRRERGRGVVGDIQELLD